MKGKGNYRRWIQDEDVGVHTDIVKGLYQKAFGLPVILNLHMDRESYLRFMIINK